ncbi:unnamed protein product [Dracunculus medinensis]|uniref:ELM2 domain-containing protein n=1 Tax=Dracunculus medinensis TaxID=318479 RepID=A0A158Q3G3_DRAME|nr:unnamed protein product [Dracunculus medinensis]
MSKLPTYFISSASSQGPRGATDNASVYGTEDCRKIDVNLQEEDEIEIIDDDEDENVETSNSINNSDQIKKQIDQLNILAHEKSHTVFRLPTNLEIREGQEYQCPVVSLEDWKEATVSDSLKNYELVDPDVCVWKPTDSLSDQELNDYLSIALSKFDTQLEQAMYILFNVNYCVKAAIEHLAKYRVLKEEWSDNEISIFKQSLQNYGKNFRRIKKLLRHRTMRDIVHFYYFNKKKMNFRSLIDIYVEEFHGDDNSGENEGERCIFCEICGIHEGYRLHRLCFESADPPIHTAKSLNLPLTCPKKFIEILSSFADDAKIVEVHNPSISISDKGIENKAETIVKPRLVLDKKLEKLEQDLMIMRGRCVRTEYDARRQLDALLADDLKEYRKTPVPSSTSRPQHSIIWTDKEKWQALFVFQRYGIDFAGAAELLGKTPGSVRSFYRENKDQIDEMILKANDLYEKGAAEYDYTEELRLPVKDEEIIDLD